MKKLLLLGCLLLAGCYQAPPSCADQHFDANTTYDAFYKDNVETYKKVGDETWYSCSLNPHYRGEDQ